MQLRPGNAQWIGKRDEQQDAFAFAHIADDYFRSHGGALALVADGMGGMANGAQASRIAVQTFVAAYNEKTADEAVADALTRALEAANRAVWELAKDSAGEGQVGTTLVAAAVLGDQLYWVSAGDSRLYLYRADGSLAQCTTDHNLLTDLMEKVRAGEMTRDQALQHPDAEAVTSFLGMQRIERIDRNLRPLPLAAGDRLLLCSDGLFGTLNDEELAAALADDPQQAAETLLQQVQARADEYQDNTTILVLGAAAADAALSAAAPAQTAAPQRRTPWLLAGLLGGAALVGAGIWLSGRLLEPMPEPQPEKAVKQAEAPEAGIFPDGPPPKKNAPAKEPPLPSVEPAPTEEEPLPSVEPAPTAEEPQPPVGPAPTTEGPQPLAEPAPTAEGPDAAPSQTEQPKPAPEQPPAPEQVGPPPPEPEPEPEATPPQAEPREQAQPPQQE